MTASQDNAKIPYGERCLPAVFDNISMRDPRRLYAVIPKSNNLADGFRDVTFGEAARCVNYLTTFLQAEFWKSDSVETIAYLGIPDLRNVIIFLGSVKCGYKLLLLSPRNTSPVNAALLSQTKCVKLLYSIELAGSAGKLREEVHDLKTKQVITLDEMFKQNGTHVPSSGNFFDEKGKPILILHSSGSTGKRIIELSYHPIEVIRKAGLRQLLGKCLLSKVLISVIDVNVLIVAVQGIPKPITMTHGTWATFDYCRNLPTVPGRKNNDFTMWDSAKPLAFYSPFPPSHLAGFLSTVIIPIFSEASYPVLGPALRPPSGALVKDVMEKQNLKGLFIPPAIAEQILLKDGGLELIKGLDFMYSAGGPLSQSAGEIISQATTLCQLYGSTESSQIPQLVPLPDDWDYMEWHPSVKHEMRIADSESNAHELVLFMDSNTEKISALNHNIPNAKEWPTRDLFIPHPSKPGLWRYHGRRDDIIVFSNGEKLFPVPMESLMSGHPLIAGALVVGQGRFQAAMIVEPKDKGVDCDDLISQIWPLIEKANRLVPSQGRITRSKILAAKPDKPFRRAAKGTIVRKLTENDYELEINDLYLRESANRYSKSLPFLGSASETSSVKDFVRSVISLAFTNVADASDDEDLFFLGLDSLKTLEIVGLLKAALIKYDNSLELAWLSTRTVYNQPSVTKLASLIHDRLSSGVGCNNPTCNSSSTDRREHMAELAKKYTQQLSLKPSAPAEMFAPEGKIFAITGSTGSLGTQLVQALCNDSKVTRIYCLDRSANAQHRHKGVGVHENRTKLQYLQTKIGEPRLGLSDPQYSKLLAEVDVIIHNAWKVDFGQILESFEKDHIRGVKRLIDLSIESVRYPRIVFISSISSVSNWTAGGSNSHVPEEPIPNSNVSAPMGYGESKHVAEIILATASAQSAVPVSILRVGQIAGSTKVGDPAWPVQEWVPSLVKTAKSSGLVPENLPSVDWIPINKLADAILELTHHDLQANEMQFYNLVNPHPAPWAALIKPIVDYCGSQTKTVTLAAWLQQLEETQATPEEFDAKPALKILEFFAQMVDQRNIGRYETLHSVHASHTMATMEPITAQLMTLWLKQWAF